MFCLPLDEGLHGAAMAEVALRDIVIVKRRATLQGVFEVFTRAEAVGGQQLGNAPVGALDYAIGLRVCGPHQAILDGSLGAEAKAAIAQNDGYPSYAVTKTCVTKFCLCVRTIREDHVTTNLRLQRTAEPLGQCHWASWSSGKPA
jgi:hypothetical protein